MLTSGDDVNHTLTTVLKTPSVYGALADTPYVKIPHKNFEIPCESCHTTESWKILKKDIEFDHSRTGFALKGVHKTTSCTQCHSEGRFNTTARPCYTCHADVHQGQLGQDCERCHTEEAWVPSTFTHTDQTFVMVGAHKALDCADCHKDLITFKMPNIQDCGDCHRPIGATSKHREYEQMGDCRLCHSLTAWDDYPHYDGWFSLRGHHRRSCETCHKDAPNYTTYTCRDCHDFDHRGDGDDDLFKKFKK